MSLWFGSSLAEMQCSDKSEIGDSDSQKPIFYENRINLRNDLFHRENKIQL